MLSTHFFKMSLLYEHNFVHVLSQILHWKRIRILIASHLSIKAPRSFVVRHQNINYVNYQWTRARIFCTAWRAKAARTISKDYYNSQLIKYLRYRSKNVYLLYFRSAAVSFLRTIWLRSSRRGDNLIFVLMAFFAVPSANVSLWCAVLLLPFVPMYIIYIHLIIQVVKQIRLIKVYACRWCCCCCYRKACENPPTIEVTPTLCVTHVSSSSLCIQNIYMVLTL